MILSYAQKEKYLHAFILLSFALLMISLFFKSDDAADQKANTHKPYILPVETLPKQDNDRFQAAHNTLSDPINDAEPSPQVLTARFPFESHIQRVAEELEADPSLIFAVTKAESSFRPDAESHAGAVGLMQIIANAAGTDAHLALHNVRRAPTEAELKDPYTNLKLGTTYLKLLEERYFRHVKDAEMRTMLVLAAYNWGPVNVKRKLLQHRPRNPQEVSWLLWVKAPRETYAYVKKVMRYQEQFDA